MDKIIDIINECRSYEDEREWFEFKENVFLVDHVGEYISALSNSTAMLGRKYAYLIWGLNDKTHEIVGTNIDYNKSINNEPIKHYLARKLNPSISFEFEETIIDNKRVVILIIPAAKIVPTSFNDIRYIRIGSSKETLKKYPEREARLFSILTFGLPTINNTASEYQNLTFNQLITYYSTKGIMLNESNFKTNLHLLTSDGKYNIMAQLLSDNSYVPIRVAIFEGRTKASKLYSVKEFGYKSLLYSLYEVLNYGEILNIPQTDENNRIMERKEIPLFNFDVYREAVINAFLHNEWINLNEPMITFYSDRIEILSRGTLSPLQTLEGFYKGHSIPINDKLSELFLQLHISEKTGRGIPKIISVYGKESIEVNDNNLTVTIPFNRVNENNKVGNKVGNKMGNKNLNNSQIKVLAEIRNNPNVTKQQLMTLCELSKTSIDNIISTLKKLGYIERIGSNKTGYWKVNE